MPEDAEPEEPVPSSDIVHVSLLPNSPQSRNIQLPYLSSVPSIHAGTIFSSMSSASSSTKQLSELIDRKKPVVILVPFASVALAYQLRLVVVHYEIGACIIGKVAATFAR